MNSIGDRKGFSFDEMNQFSNPDRLAEFWRNRKSEFSLRNISTALELFSRSRQPLVRTHALAIEELSVAVEKNIARFDSFGIMKITRSLSKLDKFSDRLKKIVEEHLIACPEKLQESGPSVLANCLHSLNNPKLAALVCNDLLANNGEKLRSCNSFDISMFVESFRKAGFYHRPFFEKLESFDFPLKDPGAASHLAFIANAFVSASLDAPKFLKKLKKHLIAENLMRQAGLQDLLSFAHFFSKGKNVDLDALNAIQFELLDPHQKRIETADAESMATFLYSFINANAQCRLLLEKIECELLNNEGDRIRKCPFDTLVKFAYCFTSLDPQNEHRALFVKILGRLFPSAPHFSLIHLTDKSLSFLSLTLGKRANRFDRDKITSYFLQIQHVLLMPKEPASPASVKVIDTFSSQDLAMLLGGLGKLGQVEKCFDLMRAIEVLLTSENSSRIKNHTGHELAIIANAFSKAFDKGLKGLDNLFRLIQLELLNRDLFKLKGCSCHELALILQSFRQIETTDGAFILAIEQLAKQKLHQASPQDLAIFACSSMNLLDSISSILLSEPQRLAQALPETLSMIANGFSKPAAERVDSRILKLVIASILPKLNQFSPEDLASIANSYSKHPVADAEFFSKIGEELSRDQRSKLKSANPSQISLILNAFGKRSSTRFQDLFREAYLTLQENDYRLLRQMTLPSLAILCKTVAKVGFDLDPNLCRILEHCAIKRLESLPQSATMSDLVNLAWGLACLNDTQSPALTRSLDCLLAMRISPKPLLNTAEVKQLQRVILCLKLENPSLASHYQPLESLLPPLPAKKQQSSETHLEVACVLKSLGHRVLLEHPLEGECVDIFFPDLGPSGAVLEVHGPSHFIDGSRLNGSSRFKERLIEKLAAYLPPVAHFEWDALKSVEDKKTYLSLKIQPYAESHSMALEELVAASEKNWPAIANRLKTFKTSAKEWLDILSCDEVPLEILSLFIKKPPSGSIKALRSCYYYATLYLSKRKPSLLKPLLSDTETIRRLFDGNTLELQTIIYLNICCGGSLNEIANFWDKAQLDALLTSRMLKHRIVKASVEHLYKHCLKEKKGKSPSKIIKALENLLKPDKSG